MNDETFEKKRKEEEEEISFENHEGREEYRMGIVFWVAKLIFTSRNA